MKNFWTQLNKPIYALAPMAGITDSAFRQICKQFGADVVYSEMVSATALAYNPERTLEMLRFSEAERPYVVQLFGSNLKHFVKATKLVSEKIKPDGIDINFGCPVPKVVKQGAGAVLMQNLKLAKQVIRNVAENTDLPVSVKVRKEAKPLTRGFASGKNVDCLKFLDYMSDLPIKAVMIHGRSLAQGFSGPMDTEIIKKARDYFNGIILANGGINSYDDAVQILDQTEADGVGIARGALGKPWIFKAVRTGQSAQRSRKAVFKIALKHAELAEKLKGKQGIIETRKHLCWYVHGLPGACEMRRKLVQVKTIKDIEKILE